MPLAADKRASIGSRIRDLRKKLGINQDQLAEFLGVSRVQISKYEHGSTNPNVENLYKLCDALKATPNDILGF